MKKRKIPVFRTYEQWSKILAEAEQTSVAATAKANNVSPALIYEHIRKQKKKTRKPYTRKTPELTTVHLSPSGKMVLLVGDTNDIRFALEKLSQIHG